MTKAEIVNEGKESLMSAEEATRKGLPEISYQNVSFAYGDKEALHGINFDAQKGQMIALVGPSGGGKSTIANLLARFWDVDKGNVTLGEKDVRDYNMDDLMKNFSFVFQNVYLFILIVCLFI